MGKNKTKILYVHHAGGFGGAPKSMSYIIANLDKNNYEPVLVNIDNGPINDFFRKLPVELIITKGIKPFHGSTVVEKETKLFIRNWLFLLPSIFKALKLINSLKPDIIHLNSTCLLAFAIAAKWSKVKPRVISHVREPLREGIWGAPLRFFCKRYVDGFIAISKFDLDSLEINGLKGTRSEVIYNFVDIDEYSAGVSTAGLREQLNIKKDEIIFLYLARFSKSNGWKELIEMAKEITPEYKNFHFVLLGANDEQVNKIPRTDNIHIMPFSKDVVNILRDSDIFVCPFTEPHFARGIIEASAVGLPILASEIGGVNELVRHGITGYLYANKEEFKQYAAKLGTDKALRNSMGNAGRLFADESFNQQTNLKRTYAFYDHYRDRA